MGGIYFLSICFFTGLFCCSYLDKIRAVDVKVLFYYFFALIIISTGFRYNFGFDFPQYLKMINTDQFDGIEQFHILLMTLASTLKWPGFYYLIISSLIFIFYFSSDKDGNGYYIKLLSLMFFIVYPLGYIESISVLRQYVSIACFICIWNRKKIDLVFLLAVAIGFFSHFSFILALLFYCLKFIRIKPNYLLYAFFAATSFLVINVILAYLISHYSYFSFYNSFEKSGFLLTLSSLIIPIISVSIIIKTNNEALYGDCNLLFCGVVLFFCLSLFNVQMARLAYYPLMIVPFVIAKLSSNRPVLRWFSFAFLFSTLCYRFYLSSQLPYDYLNNFEINIL